VNRNEWKDEASCLGLETNLFFDEYEDNEEIRPAIDKICSGCPVAKQCFAVGISQKEWGVWGGIYLEKGKYPESLIEPRQNLTGHKPGLL